MYAYKNSNTNDTVLTDDAHPELEAAPNWVSIDPAEVSDATRAAYDRAAAERRMIAEAERLRTRDRDLPDTVDGAEPPIPTAAHYSLDGTGAGPGVLDKDRRAAATQIGDDPGRHPRTKEEVAALGAYQVAHPPTTGVLTRARADHVAGPNQGDDYPDAHLTIAGAAKAAAVSDPAPPADPGGDDLAGGSQQPPRSARKADLVAWATSAAAGDKRIPAEKANAMTREALAAAYGR